MNTPFEYVDAGDLIQPDTSSTAEKWLDAEFDRRWGNEQGAEPSIVLRAIALELFTEAVGLRATEQNLRERVAELERKLAWSIKDRDETVAELEQQLAARMPDGWKLVPIEPTEAMVHAGWDYAGSLNNTFATYQAMLAASPHPVAQPEQPAPAGSDGWKAHAEDMENQRDYWRNRARSIAEHQRGDVWYWQGDGEDHLESMCNSLPVVIRADALRALVQPAVQGEPLFLLHTGDDFGGERGDWDVEANSFRVVEEFCKKHPPNTAIGLFAHPQPERVALTDEQWRRVFRAAADAFFSPGCNSFSEQVNACAHAGEALNASLLTQLQGVLTERGLTDVIEEAQRRADALASASGGSAA